MSSISFSFSMLALALALCSGACSSEDAPSGGAAGTSAAGASGAGGTGGTSAAGASGASGTGGTSAAGASGAGGTGGASAAGASGAGGTGGSGAGGNAGGAGGTSAAGAGGGAGAGAAGAGGGECNALMQLGTYVTETVGMLPALNGGTVMDGTYVLTSAVSTGSADKKTHKRTIQITGATMQVVNSDLVVGDPGGGGPDVHVTYTFTTSGNVLTLTGTCPPGLPGDDRTFGVTATGFSSARKGDNVAQTFTKQ